MGMNEQFAEITVQELKEKWGGIPDWNEYKNSNNIKVDKTVANYFMGSSISGNVGTLNGLILMIFFLITPFAIFSVFFWDLPWWYIIIGLVATIFLIKILRNYQCNYVRNLAKKDESIYKILVEKGAFIFYP